MPNAINTYTNLDRVRQYLSLASAQIADDTQIVDFMYRASRSIDRYTRRKFYPRLETRFYDYEDSQQIRLDDDLLALSALRTQNGSCPVASGVMYLGTGREWNRPPYERIVLRSDSGSVLSYSGRTQRANEVTGYWGYHEDYPNAWVDTGTSLQSDYTASAGSINVAGAGSTGSGASDIFGDAPRISVGDILKIGDQFFNVLSGGSVPQTVIIKPYANGTSGASVASGTSITRFSYEPDIEWACRRLTVWGYAQTMTPFQATAGFAISGEVQIPQSWPSDVRDRLDRFVRRTYSTFPK